MLARRAVLDAAQIQSTLHRTHPLHHCPGRNHPFTMEHGRTNITMAVRSVQLLKIDGYCATSTMNSSDYFKSSRNVDGHHDWEFRLYPRYGMWVALGLHLVSEPRRNKVWANLSCRLVDPTRNNLGHSSEVKSETYVFESPRGCNNSLVFVADRRKVPSSGYLVNDSLTVQCTITVLKEVPDVVIPAAMEVLLPASDLHRHLGELLRSQRGADVTFVLDSGERLPAHKNILAARSPVFMAEFFGHMDERRSQSVRIQDMQAGVFKAMLHFVYTDMAPELDGEPDAVATMAQHLLAAADRYGLDRLKLICEGKLSAGINIETAATTLALAEQHNCSLLKAKCVDFIARSPETFDAVVATDGYRHLLLSCPLVLTEPVRAAQGRRN